MLLNCSPDIARQIMATPALWPHVGPRHSPIAAVVPTNADIDHVGGLLTLRESHPFVLAATSRVLAALAANPMFDVLAPERVERRPLALNRPLRLAGLDIVPFPVPGKVALYLESGDAGRDFDGSPEDTIGLEVRHGDHRFHFIPGCAAMTDDLARRLGGSPLVFFDGTTWSDAEMASAGTGTKTARRMGHMPMAGPGGTLAAFAGLEVGRKVFIHINNTNPAILDDSPERAELGAAGWEVAHDGQEIVP